MSSNPRRNMARRTGKPVGSIPANPNPKPNPSTDQYEELLLQKLIAAYTEVHSRLIAVGHPSDTALRALLSHGHRFAPIDILSNILSNALAFLDANPEPSASTLFPDLNRLAKYTLSGMVGLIVNLRPPFTKNDAMYCLLKSDLHMGIASMMDITYAIEEEKTEVVKAGKKKPVARQTRKAPPVYSPPLGGPAVGGCRMLADYDASCGDSSACSTSQPDVKAWVKKNVAVVEKKVKEESVRSVVKGIASMSIREKATLVKDDEKKEKESAEVVMVMLEKDKAAFETLMEDKKDNAAVASMMVEDKKRKAADEVAREEDENKENVTGEGMMEGDEKEENVTVETGLEGDEKKEMIFDLIHKIRVLEGQVGERRQWAQGIALQAAEKISSDTSELKVLRDEHDERQRAKQENVARLDDSTSKKVEEMEDRLREAKGQVDRADAAVRLLESENANMRAETAASKLRASESNKSCSQIDKRENKRNKRLLASEKQTEKLKEEIAEEKRKIAKVQQQLIAVKEAQKETEMKWKQEIKAKERAISLLQKECRAKESADINIKGEQAALRQKIEVDIQRHKDDVQILEEERSCLKSSVGHAQMCDPTSNTSGSIKADVSRPLKEANHRVVNKKSQGSSQKTVQNGRCIICNQAEVSVLFLQCFHQVICASCSEEQEKIGISSCLCCKKPIVQRIRVYGVDS